MRLWFSIIVLLLPVSILAQLSAPGAKSVRLTSYPSSPAVRDQIFFYCNALGTEKGTLTAQRPGGTGTYNFSWYKWNDGSGSFSTPVTTAIAVTSSTIDKLDWGGYRVKIDSSGITVKTLTGWIFFDQPPLAGAKLANPLKNCYYVALDGDTSSTVRVFYYKDPANGATLRIYNKISFRWSSDPTSFIPAPDVNLDPIIRNFPEKPIVNIYHLPMEDVTYKLEVNSLGCRSESSFLYESIHVKADAKLDPLTGEAPLEVSFTDQSVRGAKYVWNFGDGTKSELADPEIHTYYKTGLYYPKLEITSALGCVDSVHLDSIYVEPSKLDIPNTFTPNGDTWNDFFKVESKSLRFVSMEIFSQSGLKVYGFSGEGESLQNWQGWDGKINNTSVEARPGIYYYIIRAFGWDDVKYDSRKYRGFVYLYR